VLKTLTGLIAVVAVLAVPAMASAATKDQKGTQVADCIEQTTGQREGVFKYDGVVAAWPPNHKERTATITLTDDDAEPATDDVTLTVTASHDQILADATEMLGSGHTTPDWFVPDAQTGNPTATAHVSFLGERSGQDQTGRVYTFTANGTTDDGLSKCEPVNFTAFVPHDLGN
jgi:hypothetical protein